MTEPLSRPERAIERRIRLLAQKLNEELGYRDQSLRFARLQARSGPTTWKLRNERSGTGALTLPDGAVAELAVAANDSSILYFGYNEEWQPARSPRDIEFVSSNLRFLIRGMEDVPDLRFRLEWAGATTDAGAVTYPGSGAAHPHWQLDIDDGWLGEPADPPAASGGEIAVDLEPAAEEIDLDGGTGRSAGLVDAQRRISATLAGFHHLHLPARAMWHDLPCVMPDIASPQQHTPESAEQIDQWVISALRYLKSEFEAYM